MRGIEFSPDMKLPRYFGKIVNDLVYDRVGFGVRQWLDDRTPVGEDGRRRHKKFQRLTEDFGVKQLLHHLGVEEGMMMGFADRKWAAFYDKLNRALPPYKKLPLFDQPPEEPKALPSGPSSAP